MKKFNKWGASHRNLELYDFEIVQEYNGTPVNEDSLVAKIIGKKETFHVFFLPDYNSKKINFGADSTSDFATQVTELMMQSGEAAHLIKQLYDKAFNKAIEPVSIESNGVTYIQVK